jgi:hypothetical protein
MAWIWEKLLLKMDASSKKMGQLIVFVISTGKLNHISCLFTIAKWLIRIYYSDSFFFEAGTFKAVDDV